MPSGCGIDVRMTLEETLGRDVDDAPSLRFVDQVRRMDASRVRASIAATSDPTRDRRIADATRAACTGGPASTVAGRAFVLAATGKSYDLSGADSDRFLALLVRTASAVAVRDRLPVGDLDATLAPLGFGARDLGSAEGNATASPVAAPLCAKPSTRPMSSTRSIRSIRCSHGQSASPASYGSRCASTTTASCVTFGFTISEGCRRIRR